MTHLKDIQAHRWTRFLAIFTLLIVACCLCFPELALAAGPPMPDPNQIAAASDVAKTLYHGLFGFELVMIALTYLFFKDDLAGLFSTLAMKCLAMSFYFLIIPQAASLAYSLVITGIFQNHDIAPVSSSAGVATTLTASATAIFVASNVAEQALETKLTLENAVPCAAGTCPTGTDMANANAVAFKQSQITFADGLAVMIGMCAAALPIQEALMGYEVDIVLVAGIILLGFAATRWTASFAEGYFRYAVSVGVKYLVFYMTLPALQVWAGATAVGGGISLFGGGDFLLGLATAAISALACNIILAAVPGFAAAVVNGQSSVNGLGALQSVLQSSQIMQAMVKNRDTKDTSAREIARMSANNRGSNNGSPQNQPHGQQNPGIGGYSKQDIEQIPFSLDNTDFGDPPIK